MRNLARLNRLEERLSPGPQKPAVLMSILLEGYLPEWASEAIQPYMTPEGVTIVTWRKGTNGEVYAQLGRSRVADTMVYGEQWYHVTLDGCEPIDKPLSLTFADEPEGRNR